MISHYTQLANQMFSGFIVGKIVDSTIIGVICFLFMSIFQFPYALLVSLIVGVTNVIPVFGPYIGAVPSVLLILIVNPVQAIYFAIWIIVLQQYSTVTYFATQQSFNYSIFLIFGQVYRG